MKGVGVLVEWPPVQAERWQLGAHPSLPSTSCPAPESSGSSHTSGVGRAGAQRTRACSASYVRSSIDNDQGPPRLWFLFWCGKDSVLALIELVWKSTCIPSSCVCTWCCYSKTFLFLRFWPWLISLSFFSACLWSQTPRSSQLGGRGSFWKVLVALLFVSAQLPRGGSVTKHCLAFGWKAAGRDLPVGLLQDCVLEALHKSSNINSVFVAKKARLSMCWSLGVCAGCTPGESWKNTYWRLTRL